MKNITFFILTLLSSSFMHAGSCADASKKISPVILIVPAVHKALDMIQAGVQNKWLDLSGESISSSNTNADPTIESRVLEFASDGTTSSRYVMCIGTGLLEKTMKKFASKHNLNEELNTYIIGVAASLDGVVAETPLQKKIFEKTFVVSDEISADSTLSFLKQTLPGITTVTLVISNAEKTLREIPALEKSRRPCWS